MKARELLTGIEFEAFAPLNGDVTSVVTDARKPVSGALFVCIRGTKFDTHTLAKEVFDAGAVLLVSEEKLDEGIPHVVVADTRAALSVIWANFYGNPQNKFSHVIGITGTNGKTSTSMMARAVFEAAGRRVGLIGTTKYVVGDREYDAPLTTPAPEDLFRYFAEMIEAGCDTLIMEVSSHSLSQKRVETIPFTVGIFTNLTQDHLDYHGTMEAYRKEKEKLFSMCRVGLINADDEASVHFLASAQCPTYTYGEGEAAFSASAICAAVDGVRYRLTFREESYDVSVPIPGNFTVYNSLAALAAAKLCGIDLSLAVSAIATMDGVPGRVERLPNTGDVSVILDYAHTPDALENVLKTLGDLPHGRIFVVFGCGGDRDPKKRPIMGRIACAGADCAIVTSDNPRTEDPEAIIADILEGCKNSPNLYAVITDRTEAIRRALTDAKAGDVVLLAGKGHEEYVIDKTGKHPYSEKKIVREFFEEKHEGQL